MAVTPGRSRTALNDTNVVTVVAAPGSGVYRHIIGLRVCNIDSVAQDVTIKRSVSGTSRQFDKRTGLAVNEVWLVADKERPIIITGTDTIEAVMGGAKTTTEPDVHAEWIDKS